MPDFPLEIRANCHKVNYRRTRQGEFCPFICADYQSMAEGRFARGEASPEGSKADARRASEIIEQESLDEETTAYEQAENTASPADLSGNVFLADPIDAPDATEVFAHDLEFKPEAQEAEKALPPDGLYGDRKPEKVSGQHPFEAHEELPLETPNKGLEGTLETISPFEGLFTPPEPTIPPENPLELPSGLLETVPEPPSETPKEEKKRFKVEAKKAGTQELKAPDVGLPSYVVQPQPGVEPEGFALGNAFLDSVVQNDGVDDIIPSFAPPTKHTATEVAVEGGRTIWRTVINLVIGLAVGALVLGYFMITMGPYTLTQFGLIRNDIPVPVNAIPEGYEVIASRWGTTPTEGLSALADPFTLDATKVRIDERVILEDGNVAYNVTCLDGSCPRGLTNTIPFKSVIGI